MQKKREIYLQFSVLGLTVTEPLLKTRELEMQNLVVVSCQKMKVAENSKLTIGKCTCKSGMCYRNDAIDYIVSFPDNLVLC